MPPPPQREGAAGHSPLEGGGGCTHCHGGCLWGLGPSSSKGALMGLGPMGVCERRGWSSERPARETGRVPPWPLGLPLKTRPLLTDHPPFHIQNTFRGETRKLLGDPEI